MSQPGSAKANRKANGEQPLCLLRGYLLWFLRGWYWGLFNTFLLGAGSFWPGLDAQVGACSHTGGEPGTRHWKSGKLSHWGSLSGSFFSLDCLLNVCFVLKPSLAGVDVVGMVAVSLARPRKIFFHLIFFQSFYVVAALG